jgi:hypothetical protein
MERKNLSKAKKKCSNISYYLEARKSRGKRGRERAFMASRFIRTHVFEAAGFAMRGWAEAEHQPFYP